MTVAEPIHLPVCAHTHAQVLMERDPKGLQYQQIASPRNPQTNEHF